MQSQTWYAAAVKLTHKLTQHGQVQHLLCPVCKHL